jgi:hypothetical protein
LDEKKKKAKSVPEIDKLQIMIQDSIPCHYVRFHQPVPPGVDKEPVSEFRLVSMKQSKYVVQAIYRHANCVIVEAYDTTFIVESANVMYSRPIL